ncbi:LIM domain kinase 1 [Bulinus truncatus]|nr:LIM domain kinase 1 [Bulinus truncatus]
MVAGEHRYHPECFQCSMCQALIGDGESYALVERSFLYCGQCYRSSTIRSSSPVPATVQTPTVAKTPRRKPHSIQMVEIPPTPNTSCHKHQQQHARKEQQKKLHQEQQSNTQLSLLATPFESGTLGVGYRNSLILDSGRLPPCVQISGLNSSPAFQDLAVGDRILEVDGTTVRDKTLEEINHLLTNYQKPVHVMVERDLSPLRLPPDEDNAQQSPNLLTKSLSRSSLEDSYSSAASDNEAAIIVQGTPVRLRPKGSLRAKGQTRQKSIDLNRSHSFSTRQQDHRVFRAVDLILGEVLGQGFFGQAIKVFFGQAIKVCLYWVKCWVRPSRPSRYVDTGRSAGLGILWSGHQGMLILGEVLGQAIKVC